MRKVLIMVVLCMVLGVGHAHAHDDVVTKGELVDVVAQYMGISTHDALQYVPYTTTPSGEVVYALHMPTVREDVVAAIVYMAGYMDRLPNQGICEDMYTDWYSVSKGLRNHVAIAVEYGLVSGYVDDTIRGQDVVTHDLLQRMVWRMDRVVR